MGKSLLASFCIVVAAQAWAGEGHSGQGILLEVNLSKREIVVSCEAIPGYMEAMVMPFLVRGPEKLEELDPGMTVHFDLVEEKDQTYAEHLQVVRVSNHEAEPTEARRLTFLHRKLNPAAAAKIVSVGQVLPDFTLTDQTQQPARLSDFRGKIVVLTFAYSRCPNPNYCFRLSNNLSILQRRFQVRMGSELILMTIVIDPDQDRGKALETYAETWKADPQAWRFLTGSVGDVRSVAEAFGMDFWSDEGFLTHSFHTAVIDREGKLAANLEGNEFTAGQLGDLVETVLRRPVQPKTSAVPRE